MGRETFGLRVTSKRIIIGDCTNNFNVIMLSLLLTTMFNEHCSLYYSMNNIHYSVH